MNEHEKANGLSKPPVLQEVLKKLERQIDLTHEYASRIFAHTNNLRDCRQPKLQETSPEVPIQLEGAIDYFENEIRRLREINDVLRMSAEGLQNLIG